MKSRRPCDGQYGGHKGPMTLTPGVTYRRGKLVQGYDVAQWLDDWNDHRAEPVPTFKFL